MCIEILSTTLVKGKTTEARNETGDKCNTAEPGEQFLKFCNDIDTFSSQQIPL